MKKTTIYKLLCTTLLTSGIAMAADEPQTPAGDPLQTPARHPARHPALSRVQDASAAGPSTPVRDAEAAKDTVRKGFPATPEIFAAKKAEWDQTDHSLADREFFAQQDAVREKALRDSAIQAKFQEIEAKKLQEESRRQAAAADKARQEEEARYDATIQALKARETAGQVRLKSQVATLTTSLAQAQEHNDTLEGQLALAKKDKLALIQQLDDITREKATAEGSLTRLALEKTKLEEDQATIKAGLDKQVQSLTLTATRAKEMLAESTKDNVQRVKEITALQEVLNQTLKEKETQRIAAASAISSKQSLERKLEQMLAEQQQLGSPMPPATRSSLLSASSASSGTSSLPVRPLNLDGASGASAIPDGSLKSPSLLPLPSGDPVASTLPPPSGDPVASTLPPPSAVVHDAPPVVSTSSTNPTASATPAPAAAKAAPKRQAPTINFGGSGAGGSGAGGSSANDDGKKK